jgi:hypothetical protein
MAKKSVASSTAALPVTPSLAAIVKVAEIADVRLLGCRASIGQVNEEMNAHQFFQVQGFLDDVGKVLRVVVRLVISAATPGPDGEPVETSQDLYIEAKYGLTYTLKSLDGITPEIAGHFAHNNGIFNVWAFWREFVQTITGRMGIMGMLIPLLKSPPPVTKITPVQQQTAGAKNHKKRLANKKR